MTTNNLDPLASRLKPIVSAVRNSLGVVVLVAPLLVSPDTVEAAFVYATDEQVVNSETTGYQRYPSMAMDADGDFVVVWASDGKSENPGAGDGDGSGIFGQRYNVAGVPQGGEFLVNSYITGSQRGPSVAMDADGDFVVVWGGAGLEDDSGIYGQRFNADGDAQGIEILVNSHTTDSQHSPSVAMDADGNFVVAWGGAGLEDDSGIHGQRFNAAGDAQGIEFRVNSHTTDGQYSPSVAMDADGDFVVVWTSDNQDGDNSGIYGQRYNDTGGVEGVEFPVNSYGTDDQHRPSVAMDALGNFAVVWDSEKTPPDSDYYGVFVRTYRANGTPDQSKEFLVNQQVEHDQYYPDVALDNDGDMAIAWHSQEAGPLPPNTSRPFDVILRTYHQSAPVPTAVPTQSMVHTGLLAGLLALLGLGAQRRRLRPKRE